MLTDKRLEYCTAGAPLQESVRQNRECNTTSTAYRGAFRLDIARVDQHPHPVFAMVTTRSYSKGELHGLGCCVGNDHGFNLETHDSSAYAARFLRDREVPVRVPQVTPGGLLVHAREFLIAAELVLGRAETVSLPAYFLIARAIELSLKAFLLGCGLSIASVRKRFGHHLENLLKEAVARGLHDHVQIDSLETAAVEVLNLDYFSKAFEYRVTGGTYYLPDIEVVEDIARRLTSGLDKFCLRRGQTHES